MSSYHECDTLSYDITAILESLTEGLDPEPEILLFKSITCIEQDDRYEFIDKKYNTTVFYKSEGHCEYNKNTIRIYRKQYYCKISKKFFTQRELLTVNKGYILNEHVFTTLPHHKFTLTKVNYVLFFIDRIRIAFVFDIEDLRKKYCHAVNNLLCHLPSDLVIDIAKKVGASNPIPKSGNTYELSDFPYDFVSKYSFGLQVTQLSRMQVKKLFDIGVMKIALMKDDMYCHFNLLTDEAFDYKFPSANGLVDNKIKTIFKTKENMHGFIEKTISKLFY